MLYQMLLLLHESPVTEVQKEQYYEEGCAFVLTDLLVSKNTENEPKRYQYKEGEDN